MHVLHDAGILLQYFIRLFALHYQICEGQQRFQSHVAPVTKTDRELRRVMTYTRGLEDGMDLSGFCSSYRPL